MLFTKRDGGVVHADRLFCGHLLSHRRRSQRNGRAQKQLITLRSKVNPSLQLESENLVRSWAQHNSAWLRDYLIAGVEDPRLNLQSLFSRHFIIRSLTEDRFVRLLDHEYRFAAVMNWITGRGMSDIQELEEILCALRRGSDNA